MGNETSTPAAQDAEPDRPTPELSVLPPVDSASRRRLDRTMTQLTQQRTPKMPALFVIHAQPSEPDRFVLCWTDMASATPRIATVAHLSAADRAAVQADISSDRSLPQLADDTLLTGGSVFEERTRLHDVIYNDGFVTHLGDVPSLHGVTLRFRPTTEAVAG